MVLNEAQDFAEKQDKEEIKKGYEKKNKGWNYSD